MRIPVATYRLQVNADFTLAQATGIADYLHALGITDIYLSPIFEAVPGSTHGYNVTDPTRIGTAAGGRAGLRALSGRARALGMGIVLDIVPNHMAASEHSPWWRDVLRHGRSSPYADYFDIDWETEQAPGRLLLPVLGATLDELLQGNNLDLVEGDDGEWCLDLGPRRLPVAIEQCRDTAIREYQAASAERRREILTELLQHQHYQLTHWQAAAERLGYRRFFDITDLAGVRVESEEVFTATHALVLELVHNQEITGLRIDHVDGLRDPAGYLERLRAATGCYTVVEKILQRDEPLPAWQVEGTTGYDFLNMVNGLFIEEAGYERIGRAYLKLTGEGKSFHDTVREKKLLVMDMLFGGERTALSRLLQPLLGAGFDAATSERALVEITAALPVYRTYVRDGSLSERDREVLEHAFTEMRAHITDLPAELPHRLRRVMLLEAEETRAEAAEFLARWQQFTGPVMAKGFEDTAFYVHTAFIAACEVGGDPARACLSVAAFHARMVERARSWRHTMNATATHDTKRGEGARARLDVLSELGEEWPRILRAWANRSEEHREEAALVTGLAGDDMPVPNAREESLLYQTLLGAWPVSGEAGSDFIERIKQYMVKALREAKESTSWHKPDADYESFLAAFVDTLLAEPWWPGLREEIRAYADKLAWHGALNSLSQTLLKITCPGIPDFYQGTELWSLSLVDPDNRQSVDFQERRRLLAGLEPLLEAPSPAGVRSLLDDWRTGRVKLYLIAAALRFRRKHAQLFGYGSYLPLQVTGSAAEHLVAFARSVGTEVAITVVPRLLVALCPPGELPDQAGWGDTAIELPPELHGRDWRNVLTGERVGHAYRLRAADLLSAFPSALLGQRGGHG